MTCASPFTTYSTLLLFELVQPGGKRNDRAGLQGLLRVVVFGDADDNVHHIRHATAAYGAAIELAINLGRHHQLPRIGLEQVEDDVLDFLAGDHVALTDEHGAAGSLVWWPHKATPIADCQCQICRSVRLSRRVFSAGAGGPR